ncbi:MAG: HEAT repeat domain-containing protein [Planctomycetota bacterium]
MRGWVAVMGVLLAVPSALDANPVSSDGPSYTTNTTTGVVTADPASPQDPSADPSGLTAEDRARMEPLWEESCQWTVGEQKAKTEEARGNLTMEPKILAYLILKQPTINNTLKFRAVWGILNPLKEKGLPFYSTGLNHPSKDVRQATLTMLVQADVPMDKSLKAPLLRLLKDEGHFGSVLGVLGRFKDDSALPEALGRLKPGSARRMLVSCSLYVAHLGGQAAAKSLMNLLGDDRFEVRSAVCGALGSLGESAHAPLKELLTSPERRLRLGAIEALALAKCPREALDPLLLDNDTVVRAAAARALLTLGVPREELVRVLKDQMSDPLIAGALAP